MLKGLRVHPRGLGFIMRAVDAFEESSVERCQGHIRALGITVAIVWSLVCTRGQCVSRGS